MTINHEEAIEQGREDGFAAGLAGEAEVPDSDPLLAALDPEYEGLHQQGAALGFARGKERWEMVRRQAEQQIEDREVLKPSPFSMHARMARFALARLGFVVGCGDMKPLILRRRDIDELGFAMDRHNDRIDRGRMYARIACRHGERGLSPEGLIRLADMFDNGSIVTCAAWLHQMNIRRKRTFRRA